MNKLNIDDVLATSYLSAKAPPIATKNNTALLLIDIQYLATPDYLADRAIQAGLEAKHVHTALADYRNRFDAALEKCEQVLRAARANNIPPIHVKIQSLSGDARDTGALHRRLGWQFPPKSAEGAFIKQTSPRDGEIVITKTASGAFTGTGLGTTLRNMGIEHLLICGFVTDECVETTSRVALDLGYVIKIIEDATTTYHKDAWAFVINKFAGFGFTASTEQAVRELEGLK